MNRAPFEVPGDTQFCVECVRQVAWQPTAQKQWASHLAKIEQIIAEELALVQRPERNDKQLWEELRAKEQLTNDLFISAISNIAWLEGKHALPVATLTASTVTSAYPPSSTDVVGVAPPEQAPCLPLPCQPCPCPPHLCQPCPSPLTPRPCYAPVQANYQAFDNEIDVFISTTPSRVKSIIRYMEWGKYERLKDNPVRLADKDEWQETDGPARLEREKYYKFWVIWPQLRLEYKSGKRLADPCITFDSAIADLIAAR